MEICFLEASGNRRLVKTYTRDNSGNITKTPYPNVVSFKSHKESFSSLSDLMDLMQGHAERGNCMIKGMPSRDLQYESRRGTHNPSAPTQLMVLDFDGLKDYSIDQAMALLGLDGVAHIVQYSASAGLEPEKGLSAHVFFLLSKPYTPAALKAWLTWKNLSIPQLRRAVKLTASARALWWPLDVTVCQNDKLIFIADPDCHNIEDHMAGKRWEFYDGKENIELEDVDIQALSRLKTELLNELRTAAGLDTRKTTYNKDGIVSNPETAVVAEEKVEGDFVRINFLGEHASWGHWYPTDNPEVLFSFKDEDPVLLNKIDPEYYRRAKARADELRVEEEDAAAEAIGQAPDARDGLHYLAFIDDRTDQFFIGTYDPSKDKLDLRMTRSKEKVEFFLMEHRQEVPAWYPRWRYEMDITNDKTFDPANKFLNQFELSEPLRLAKTAAPVTEVPTVTKSLILHICNNDEEVYEHFLNWLACKIQHRERIGTAWLFHGTMGTGKGTLFNYALRPIFGDKHTNAGKLSDFEGDHNGFLPECTLRLIDEADAEAVKNLAIVRSNLWASITEPFGTVNVKFVQQYEAANYTDYLLFSNKTIPIDIEDGDRRFNVAPRQELPYPGNDRTGLRDAVSGEVGAFANYLLNRPADIKKARDPIANEAKSTLASQQLTSVGELCYKIRKGDIDYFMDFLPADPRMVADDALPMYEDVISLIVNRDDQDKLFIQGEVSAMFTYLTEKLPSRTKFTSMLKKNGLIPKRLRRGAEPAAAIEVEWKVSKEAKARWKAYNERKHSKVRAA